MPPRKKKGKVVSSRQPSVRVPQTASHRIRKTKKAIVVEDHIEEDENVELEEEHDEEIEQVDENESDGESKLGIYSGGPIDNQVLVDYEDHIARKIWAGKVLLEVDNVSKYAWGAAALAYLYRELAKASQRNGRQVAGCMTLLEVYWDPYKDVRDIQPLDDVTFFNGVLCVLDIAEGYNIDRVLRQVGYVQRIPGFEAEQKTANGLFLTEASKDKPSIGTHYNINVLCDDASVWSVQVNTSTRDEDEEEEIEEEDYNEEEEADYEEHDGEEGGLVDELCEGISKIFLQKKTLPDFEGKHIRFVYNSDGELKGEVVVMF
ncbi:hypothetical protein IFM89_012245 [Coptis chinensis]|uniref:Aminotransferase-like plant mobile domain-containing protein n=1 Tax=Coptis chinensis TaxID=261450 RepID=A0A835LM40_9MAGN|nr:hypothetical protein IFM89_012245 [Coptis chinensis]